MASINQHWHLRDGETITCEINHVVAGPNDWLRFRIGRDAEVEIILDNQSATGLANLGICMVETGVAIQKMAVKKDTSDEED